MEVFGCKKEVECEREICGGRGSSFSPPFFLVPKYFQATAMQAM